MPKSKLGFLDTVWGKTCTGECATFRPFSDFGKRGNAYRSQCKECRAKAARADYKGSTGARAGIGGKKRKYK